MRASRADDIPTVSGAALGRSAAVTVMQTSATASGRISRRAKRCMRTPPKHYNAVSLREEPHAVAAERDLLKNALRLRGGRGERRRRLYAAADVQREEQARRLERRDGEERLPEVAGIEERPEQHRR